MNRKQAIRASNMRMLEKKIEELEYTNIMRATDIQDYVKAMLAVIEGESPCDWCEEKRLGECEHPEEMGKGCQGWWLRLRPDHPLAQQMEEQKKGEDANDSERILPAGETSGE